MNREVGIHPEQVKEAVKDMDLVDRATVPTDGLLHRTIHSQLTKTHSYKSCYTIILITINSVSRGRGIGLTINKQILA